MELATSIISLITSIIALVSGIVAIFTVNKVKNHIENVRINSPTNNINNVYNSMAEKYDRVYHIDEWERNQKGEYLLSISAIKHNINNPSLVVVQKKENGDWVELPTVDKHIVNDGTIVIISDVKLEARVSIM